MAAVGENQDLRKLLYGARQELGNAIYDAESTPRVRTDSTAAVLRRELLETTAAPRRADTENLSALLTNRGLANATSTM